MTGLAELHSGGRDIQKPHIMFAAVSAYPLGGIAVWLDYMTKGLSNRGYKVSVLLTSGKWHDVEEYQRCYPDLPNVIRVRNKTGSRVGRVNAIFSAIAKAGPDIVISANLPDCVEAVNRIKRKSARDIRNVVAIHGIQPDAFSDIDMYSGMLDGVIGTNRLIVKLAEKLTSIDRNKIHYAQCGTQACSHKTGSAVAGGNKKRIAWVGRYEEFHKRVLDAVHVTGNLPTQDYELLMVGGGPCKELLVEELANSNMTESVKLIDTLDKSGLYEEIYSRVHALLITSFSETGPMVMWEAMSMGIPVVTSRFIGSQAENSLVDGENCLFYETGNYESAATQIRRLEDEGVRRMVIKGGHNLVNSKYNDKSSVDAWERVIGKIHNQKVCSQAVPEVFQQSGRLDRLLGVQLAEVVRKYLGIRHEHKAPGDEWPHSYSDFALEDQEFWQVAKSFDIR